MDEQVFPVDVMNVPALQSRPLLPSAPRARYRHGVRKRELTLGDKTTVKTASNARRMTPLISSRTLLEPTNKLFMTRRGNALGHRIQSTVWHCKLGDMF